MDFSDKTQVWATTPEGGSYATHVIRHEDRMSWHDLTHSRSFDIKKVTKNTPEEFRFTDKQGRKHWLKPVDEATAAKVRAAILGAFPTQ